MRVRGLLRGSIQWRLNLERPARLQTNPQDLFLLRHCDLWLWEGMLLGKIFVEIEFTACRHSRFKLTAHLGVALLQIRYELQYAIFGVTGRLFLFVPIGYRTT